jgi:hypothetical protein
MHRKRNGMTNAHERELRAQIRDLEDRVVSTDWLAEAVEALDNKIDALTREQKELLLNSNANAVLMAKAVDKMSAALGRHSDALIKMAEADDRLMNLFMDRLAELTSKPAKPTKSKPDLKVVPPGDPSSAGGPPTTPDPA